MAVGFFDPKLNGNAWYDPLLVSIAWFDKILTDEGVAGVTETLSNSATASFSLLESLAESDSLSSSGSQSISTADAEQTGSSGSGSISVSDATGETFSTSESSTQSILETLAEIYSNQGSSSQGQGESIGEGISNSQTASITIDEQIFVPFTTDDLSNSGTSSLSLKESLSESDSNSSSGAQSISSESISESQGSQGSGSQSASDAIAESISTSQSSSQSDSESISEIISQSETSNQSISESLSEGQGGQGSGSQSFGEGIAEQIRNYAPAYAIALGNNALSGSSTVTISPSRDIEVGEFIVLGIVERDWGIVSVADNSGGIGVANNYVKRASWESTDAFAYLYESRVTRKILTTDQLTVTFNGAAGNKFAGLLALIGVDSGTPFDQASDRQTNNSVTWIGNNTGLTTQDKELIIGLAGAVSADATPGDGVPDSPWLELIDREFNSGAMCISFQSVSSPAQFNYSGTWTDVITVARETVVIATFKASGIAPTSIQTFSEALQESVSNSATSTQTIDEKIVESISQTEQSSQLLSNETIAEGLQNSSNSPQTIDDSIQGAGENFVNIGTGSQTIDEAIVESISNSETSNQVIGEVLSEAVNNSSSNFLIIADLLTEGLLISGTGTHSVSDATAESVSSLGTATVQLTDAITILVLPNRDLSTGTWHNTPLYPKIDEIAPDDADYIDSGDHPNNDTALIGLEPFFKPVGINENYFINVRFRKVETIAGVLNFTLILKNSDGSVIATRSFNNISNDFVTVRSALSPSEIAAIITPEDVRYDLVANEV